MNGEKSDYWIRRGAGPASPPCQRSVPPRDILAQCTERVASSSSLHWPLSRARPAPQGLATAPAGIEYKVGVSC